MKSDFFIPQKIKVGYQKRSDTYTKMLAYVIYYDEKGKLRKETSWESWRDEKIEPNDYENKPTSGFVLNKKVGDYRSDWNHRMAHVRVYDSRGFEFEISVENLLYILENTSSIKGKGLEGEFVYGWDGKELVLIPVESPDYTDLNALNVLRFDKNYIKAKDLKIGATYLTKTNKKMIYLGKFDYYAVKNRYSLNYYRKDYGYEYELPVKTFYFADEDKQIKNFHSITGKFISVVDENCTVEYSELYGKLEHQHCFSPIDSSKMQFVPYTKEEIVKRFSDGINWGNKYFYTSLSDKRQGVHTFYEEKEEKFYISDDSNDYRHEKFKKYTKDELIDALFNEFKMGYINTFLTNGKLYQKRES